MYTDILLRADKLVKEYPKGDSFLFKKHRRSVIKGVSFKLEKGQCLAVLGESGSGKTTLGNMLAGLEAPTSGNHYLEGKPVFPLGRFNRKWYFGQVQMVFQDALSSLNSARRIGRALKAPLKNFQIDFQENGGVGPVHSILKAVGLNPKYLEKFPHELSGGELQRVNIGRALLCKPKIVILDEPVSGLDVSIKAQILNLLADLKEQFDLTYFLITSEPKVAAFLSDIVGILYDGALVEIGVPSTIIKNPVHPYTQILLASLNLSVKQMGNGIGMVNERDSIAERKSYNGCRFYECCKKSGGKCGVETPSMSEYSEGHYVACFYPGEDKMDSSK